MKILAYKSLFLNINKRSWHLLEEWAKLTKAWNDKINLISRKDINALESKHLLHCLAVTNILFLKSGAKILDVGTGGGLPGLPMAICYPNANFTLIDSIGKKVKAVSEISKELGLKNVEVKQIRAENMFEKFDFVTGRAVKNLPKFISWTSKNLRIGNKNNIDNGLLYWKGSDYKGELAYESYQPDYIYNLGDMLKEEYFLDKYLLYFKADKIKPI